MATPKKKATKKTTDTTAVDKSAISVPTLLPTTEQLAMVAAALVRTSNPRAFMPSVLTKQAMELWEWSQETIHLTRFEDRLGQLEKRRQAAEADLTRLFKPTDKYPVTRDALLNKLLPKVQGRREKLAKIGKEFWCERLIQENLVNKVYKSPTPEEIDFAYDNWGPFQIHMEAAIEALHFQIWYDRYATQKRSVASRLKKDKIKKRNDRKSKKEVSAGDSEEHSLNLSKKNI